MIEKTIASETDIALLMGTTRAEVRGALAKGVIVRSDGGKLDLGDCIKRLVADLRSRLAAAEDTSFEKSLERALDRTAAPRHR